MKARSLPTIFLSLTLIFFVETSAANAASPVTPSNSPTPLSGQTNGEVDSSQLVHVTADCAVARSAASSLMLLFKDAKSKGINLGTNECYRPLDDQVAVSASWTAAGNSSCAAAVNTAPSGKKVGTSMHGWGKAVDFANISFGNTVYNYLKANAGKFGWNHPGWAEPGGSTCPEAWHWEYVGDGGTANADVVRSDVVGFVRSANNDGYASITGLGGVNIAGGATNYGAMSDKSINWTMVGAASTSDRKGYWMVGGDGGVFSFGDAAFYGSTGSIKLNQPVVGMSATPAGQGYWSVASDGGIFSFGDAKFYGSTGSMRLNKPVVSMASSPTGNGYWLCASDGGIFAYGDAQFYGSTGSIKLAQPVVAMAATPSGHGYWFVASDGGIFAYGDAQFFGSAAGKTDSPVTAFTPTATGLGYWLTTANGTVYPFGDAASYGAV